MFMKVFNEMQGYCGSIPYLAEFERQLDNEGRFEEFKEKFEANAGAPFGIKRDRHLQLFRDKVVKTLVEMDFMSEEAARNWCKNAKGSYDLSIEKFVSLVQEYCAKEGPNHHVIFLVDEIGQYIADDTQLFNLQTIVEDLGTACKGKAWVIVTSQEDIDSITKTKGNDFSKIQGRFDELSLSASNVDEVIRKRVLAKNETATQTLRLLYEQKESIIKNLITFTADADKKLYPDFADCYPFIPYQFNLFRRFMPSDGASGKHLSDQSRSRLLQSNQSDGYFT